MTWWQGVVVAVLCGAVVGLWRKMTDLESQLKALQRKVFGFDPDTLKDRGPDQ